MKLPSSAGRASACREVEDSAIGAFKDGTGSGNYRGTSEQHYRCYLPVLAGFMRSRLHGARSLTARDSCSAERAGLEPAQAVRPAALPTRCHTIRRLSSKSHRLDGGEGGFEPTVPVKVQRFSRPPDSAARTSPYQLVNSRRALKNDCISSRHSSLGRLTTISTW